MGKSILYTTSGKWFRGFLCMVTFCAFMAGLILSVVGIQTYGTSLIESNDYFSSDAYQRDMRDELNDLLNDITCVYGQGENGFSVADGFSITDVDAGKIYYYDTLELWQNREDLNLDQSLSKLDGYKTSEKTLTYDLADYDQMVQYLNSDIAQNNYIYFSTQTFKNLFFRADHVNKDYRFSSYFSNEAYFVFDNAQIDQQEEEESVVYEIGWDDSREEYTRTAVSVNMEESNRSYDFDDMAESADYAVYDPKQDIFYSPNDDFFEEMGSYLYEADSLKSVIVDTEYPPDNIVLPLLKSYNMSVNEMTTHIVMEAQESALALERLQSRQSRGMLLYDIENTRFHSSNVENVFVIQNLPYAYVQDDSGTESGVLTIQGGWMLEDYDEDFIHNLEGDSVFYFGVDPDRAENQINQDDTMSWKYRHYSFFAKGIECILVGTFLALILLIAQAVWLIRTTGKRAKEDQEIALNRFDRLPTELWVILYFGILINCVNFARRYILDSGSLLFVVAGGILITLPFGFCFMVLTLSLARRIKARNLWSALYCKAMPKRIWKKAGEFCSKRKDTEKLILLFMLYVLLEIFSIIEMFWFVPVGLILFALIQIIAGVVVFGISRDIQIVTEGVSEITSGHLDYKCEIRRKVSPLKGLGDGVNHIGDGLKTAVETSLRDERMKTELITNVSHDLKTPLTSIINYINLLKTQKMPTKEAEHYVEVLDGKAQRLRQLTEDLIEAAKANTGNIELERIPLAFDELMKQAIGEFEDKFVTRHLTVLADYPEESAMILADGRRMFRILENVLQNAYKYALEGTRIYAQLSKEQGKVMFVLKNISAAPLNISVDELMERFTRGDAARTTEGSGLGLSIARDLTTLQGGSFEILLDGDLFKVVIIFPEHEHIQ